MYKLADAVEMMQSAEYKERFKAEYYQVLIRYQSLVGIIEAWDNGTLDFTPTCPRSIYDLQLRAMKDYIAILEARAVMENVKL